MKSKIAFILLFVSILTIPAVWADSGETQTTITNIPRPPVLRQIIFKSSRDGHGEIYRINDDGSNLQRLTHSPGNKDKPQVSPDGSKIVYILRQGDHNQLWVMGYNGENPTRVVDNCLLNPLPAWSPDGTKILYSVQEDIDVINVQKNKLYVVDANGQNKVCLTPADMVGSNGAWTSENKVVGYLLQGGDSGIFVMSPDGKERTKLTKELGGLFYGPEVSANGQRIVYAYSQWYLSLFGYEIHVMNTGGHDNFQVTTGELVLSISPDGSSLAICKPVGTSNNVSEGEKVYATFLVNAAQNGASQELVQTGREQLMVSWSPDSKKISYFYDYRIWIKDLSQNKEVKVKISYLGGKAPDWSPDGQKLLFVGKAGAFKKTSIYVLNADGAGYKQITNSTGDSDPVWGLAVTGQQ
jgi:Tol biopolymer transport system component